MILLTVGTQLPFDRFVRLVDDIAPTLPMPVLAQIGTGRFHPAHMEWRDFIGPVEFEALVRDCAFIVSHAGIGRKVKRPKAVAETCDNSTRFSRNCAPDDPAGPTAASA